MRSTFLKFVLLPAVAAAAALVTPSANAATVNVPFNFSAMGKAFPAGSYQVNEDLNGNFVTLRSQDGTISLTRVLGAGGPDNKDYRVVLRFDVNGADYVLDSIQYRARVTSHMTKSHHQDQERIIAGQ